MQISRKYREIGKKLINERPELAFINDYQIKIAFLSSREHKKKGKDKIVMGQCIKVDERYSWCCKHDFMIVLYEPNIEHLTKEQIEILLLHELYHIGVDEDGIEPRLYVKPHDVEEFDAIINEFGLRWERG